jgi:hypothetical protein
MKRENGKAEAENERIKQQKIQENRSEEKRRTEDAANEERTCFIKNSMPSETIAKLKPAEDAKGSTAQSQVRAKERKRSEVHPS